jgi:excinuclease ABC subunit C
LEENEKLPQLIVIDGGKGQLNAAVESLIELDLYGKIAILGIAKRLEELFFPNDPYPVSLDKNSSTLKIIQNLRNEAHRFGITFHRNKRSVLMINSSLEKIKGVGKKTEAKLLDRFGSVANLKSQPINEIEKIVSARIAKILMEALK